ncbi:MAG: NUDIX domain-containing protein [Actinomycetota bacterium]|nr:NUDIX domain-containing protein [Actinomycetota bacterium]
MGDTTAGLRIRDAVRALVLDPDDRVLLVRFEFPNTGTWWAMPGGGVEPGESDDQALRRELDEELGLADPVIGPHIWNRLHMISFVNGLYDGQQERIYLVRTAAFVPAPRLDWQQLNAEFVYELRWWRPHELRPGDGVRVVPTALHAHLAHLRMHGPPKRPIDVGV